MNGSVASVTCACGGAMHYQSRSETDMRLRLEQFWNIHGDHYVKIVNVGNVSLATTESSENLPEGAESVVSGSLRESLEQASRQAKSLPESVREAVKKSF